MRLDDALLYLVTPARIATGEVADIAGELKSAGVDLLQLREKDMEAAGVLRVGTPLLEACREAGLPFILNDRPDIAVTMGADGVHVGQDDLPVEATRGLVGDRIVGLSTHSREQVDATATLWPLLDYVAVGPVHETPTKPGRPGTGLDLVGYAAERIPLPWFVTGGMNTDTLPEAIEAGVRRIVVVRAIIESDDPPAAAHRLKQMLLDVR